MISYYNTRAPSKLAQAVTLLICIPEVSGLSLGQDTDYPYSYLSWFSPVPPGKCRDSALNYAMTASFHLIFNSYTYYELFCHLTLCGLSYRRRHLVNCKIQQLDRPRMPIVWAADSVVKNSVKKYNIIQNRFISIAHSLLDGRLIHYTITGGTWQ
jgi:hypothetical protein